MSSRFHRLIGLYSTRQGAMLASSHLQAEGFLPQQLRLCQNPDGVLPLLQVDDSHQLLGPLVGGATMGLMVGGPIGLGFSLMLASGTAAASGAPNGFLMLLPLLGGTLGALLGAALNAGVCRARIGYRIQQALAQGQVVLVVHPNSSDEVRRARRLIRQSGEMTA
jgi:hypothetical protein